MAEDTSGEDNGLKPFCPRDVDKAIFIKVYKIETKEDETELCQMARVYEKTNHFESINDLGIRYEFIKHQGEWKFTAFPNGIPDKWFTWDTIRAVAVKPEERNVVVNWKVKMQMGEEEKEESDEFWWYWKHVVNSNENSVELLPKIGEDHGAYGGGGGAFGLMEADGGLMEENGIKIDITLLASCMKPENIKKTLVCRNGQLRTSLVMDETEASVKAFVSMIKEGVIPSINDVAGVVKLIITYDVENVLDGIIENLPLMREKGAGRPLYGSILQVLRYLPKGEKRTKMLRYLQQFKNCGYTAWENIVDSVVQNSRGQRGGQSRGLGRPVRNWRGSPQRGRGVTNISSRVRRGGFDGDYRRQRRAGQGRGRGFY